MPSLKPILFFVVKAALLYGLLLIPWPGLMTAYRAAFCAGGNVFLRTLGDGGRAYFEPAAELGKGPAVEVGLHNIRAGRAGEMARFKLGAHQFRLWYLSTGFTIALILATPVPWRRRLLALLAGFSLIGVFIGFQVWLRLADVLSNANPLAVYSFGAFRKSAVKILILVLSKTPVTAFIMPTVIWALVTIRRDDVAKVASMMRTHGPRLVSDGS